MINRLDIDFGMNDKLIRYVQLAETNMFLSSRAENAPFTQNLRAEMTLIRLELTKDGKGHLV